MAIVDAADEMTPAAANALLKILEEPPPRAALLLVAHQPARLLPTIRSRCRTLALRPLGDTDLARAAEAAGRTEALDRQVVALAAGSVGAALAMRGWTGQLTRCPRCARSTTGEEVKPPGSITDR